MTRSVQALSLTHSEHCLLLPADDEHPAQPEPRTPAYSRADQPAGTFEHFDAVPRLGFPAIARLTPLTMVETGLVVLKLLSAVNFTGLTADAVIRACPHLGTVPAAHIKQDVREPNIPA
jgi:hypothetical protein